MPKKKIYKSRNERQTAYLKRKAASGYKRKTVVILASMEGQIMAEIRALIKKYETKDMGVK